MTTFEIPNPTPTPFVGVERRRQQHSEIVDDSDDEQALLAPSQQRSNKTIQTYQSLRDILPHVAIAAAALDSYDDGLVRISPEGLELRRHRWHGGTRRFAWHQVERIELPADYHLRWFEYGRWGGGGPSFW